MRWCLLGAIVFISACGALSPPRADAGSGGGVAGGSAGGDATGGGTAGGSQAGGAGGGGAADAGLPPGTLTFETVSVQSPSTASIVALGGEEGNLWAYQISGHVLHSVSGSLQVVGVLGSTSGAGGIYASGTAVVVVTAGAGDTCVANCTNAAAFTQYPWPGTEQGVAACGNAPASVYAVLETLSEVGVLYGWNGTSWTRLDGNLPLTRPHGCSVDQASGDVFVAGQGGVARYHQGSSTLELVPNTMPLDTWRSVVAVDGEVQAVGENQLIAHRGSATGTWVLLNSPTLVLGSLYAIGGASADHLLAAGGAANPTRTWYVWNGSTWAQGPEDLPGFGTMGAVFSILPVSDTQMYFGGSNISGPVVLRVTRH